MDFRCLFPSLFSLPAGCEEVVRTASPSALEICPHPGSCASWRARSQSVLHHQCQSTEPVFLRNVIWVPY